jgi:hypothetical protein
MIKTVSIKCDWSPIGSNVDDSSIVYTDTASVTFYHGVWSVRMVLHGQMNEQEFVGGGDGFAKEAVAFMRACAEYYYVAEEMRAWFRYILLLEKRCDKLEKAQSK